MDITLKRIEMLARPEVVARGRAYFHKGRVTLMEVEDDYVQAIVSGSEEYTVELREEKNGLFVSACDCPYAHDYDEVCKHVVATMLATMYHQAKVIHLAGTPDEQRTPQEQESWVSHLRRILPPRNDVQLPRFAQKAWRLAYGITPHAHSMSIFPIRIRLKADGSDGTASVLRQLSVADIADVDATDRIALRLMMPGFTDRLAYYDEVRGTNYSSGISNVATNTEDNPVVVDLLTILPDKEVYLTLNGKLPGKRVYVQKQKAQIKLLLDEVGDALHVQPVLVHEKSMPLPPDFLLLASSPLWILVEDKVMQLEGISQTALSALKSAAVPVIVPERDKEEFLEEMLPLLASGYHIHSNVPLFATTTAGPQGRLYLREVDDKLAAELRFVYEGIEVPEFVPQTGNTSQPVPEFVTKDGRMIHVQRKYDAEAALSKRLFDASLSAMFYPTEGILYVPTIHPFEWLATTLPALRAEGFEIFGQEELKKHRLRYDKAHVGLRVSSGVDWFDLAVDVKFEGAEMDFASFVKAVKNNERFVRLDDGSVGMLHDEWVRKFRRTLAIAERSDAGLHFSRTHLGLINDLLATADAVDTDDVFEEMRERFRTFSSIGSVPLPADFRGELRPYQKAGYDWLHFLREFGVGGILADDMGLGKTVQALALLQKAYEDDPDAPPSLVVVPASPLFNWKKEIERFTPGLRTLVHSGISRKRDRKEILSHQVILASYGVLRRDIDFLADIEFLYVILDESQNIKNPVSVNARAARTLKARHKLALSGTPVENNLTELWSQFAFLNPGMLGSERQFVENFAKPIERFQDDSASQMLKQLLFPFILRRTKELVAQELPPKVESTVYCDMSPEQKRAYEHWRRYYREEIMSSIETIGLQRSKLKVLEGLTRLRQVCCHPLLVDKSYKGSAGKMEAFAEMVGDVLAEGHKVLVFSQFVKMLKVLRDYCDEQGIIYEYLDGSTTDRQERVERFQSDENVKLFLISLKAGGTGLNLTAADYVIHYDPWWNPAVEMQATDRTHRIGQTRQVFAYKLITRESVEEKILALQERKQALVKSIITTDAGFFKALTKEDVESLFS